MFHCKELEETTRANKWFLRIPDFVIGKLNAKEVAEIRMALLRISREVGDNEF